MAGVAPQQRGSAMNGSTIGMIAAIVVAVLLLGVLIWLITQQEQLRTTAEQATAARNRLARANEETTAKQLFPDAGGAGKTLVGEMVQGVQALCGKLGGSSKDPPQAALSKLDAAVEKISTDESVPNREQFAGSAGAVPIIEGLYQTLRDEHEAHVKTEADLKKASQDLEAAQRTVAELQKRFGEDLNKMAAQVQSLQTAKSDFEKLKADELAALASQIRAKQDELGAMRQQRLEMSRTFRTQLEERERLLSEQKVALEGLRGPPAEKAQELSLARQPIGTVLRALPGDSLVHIDLGRENNVSLGMTFAIYSNDERVPLDGRGKALVEVASVGRRTAECRVTSPPSPDDPILEGDKAGNIVLARAVGQKQRFCVIGSFDVDFDGQDDARGALAVRALIERYGGEVVDRVDASTSYLIVGNAPPVEALVPEPRPAVQPVPSAAAPKPAAAAEPHEEEEVEEAEPASEDETEDAEGEEADETASEEADDAEATADVREDAETTESANGEQAVEVAVPPAKASAEIDATAGPQARRALTDRDRYEEAIRRAEQLAIPRLTAERFFNFVGIEPGAAGAQRLAS